MQIFYFDVGTVGSSRWFGVHRGAATFLIFDERTPSQRDGDDEDQIFTWYYREKNQQIGESADSAAVERSLRCKHTAAAPKPQAQAQSQAQSQSVKKDKEEKALVAGGGGGGGGSGGGGGGGGAPAAAAKSGQSFTSMQSKPSKSAARVLQKIISDRGKGLWTSKFIKDFKWRANFLKLARTINCETELTNRFVVSGREKRLQRQMQRKSNLLFQSLVNKQPRISRDLLPNSCFL